MDVILGELQIHHRPGGPLLPSIRKPFGHNRRNELPTAASRELRSIDHRPRRVPVC